MSRAAPPAARWLLAAPYRLAFAAASLVWIVNSLAWAVRLGLAGADAAPVTALPPGPMHALQMSLSPFAMLFAGFAFTAFPRWLQRPPLQAGRLAPALGLLVVASLALQVAHWLPPGSPAWTLASLALATMALGWGRLVRELLAMQRASPAPDKLHARCAIVACVVGVLAMAAAALAMAVRDLAMVRAIAVAALWGFVGPVFVSVAHRMIPFFAEPPGMGDGLDTPPWLLVLLLSVLGLQSLAMLTEVWIALPSPIAVARAAVSSAVGLLLLVLAVTWARRQNLRAPMLAMLWGGLVWLGLALALDGLDGWLRQGGSPGLGLAPVHAYGMGFLGSTMLVMVGRVSAGHGGRSVAADRWLVGCYLAWQLAVLIRLAAAWTGGAWAAAVAATAAAAVLAAWAGRHVVWYLSPRPDGRPG